MEASLNTEYLSAPQFSVLSDKGNKATEYAVQYPASAVQTEISVEGSGEGRQLGANVYPSPDPSKQQNRVDAFGYCSYAPSRAFRENCGSQVFGCDSNENNCLTNSSEVAGSQRYAVKASTWCTPGPAEFQYSNIGNAANDLSLQRNTAGTDDIYPEESQAEFQYLNTANAGNDFSVHRNTAELSDFDPQESPEGASYLENQATERWYHSLNTNSDRFYASPRLSEDFYQNANSLQSHNDYISNYQYSYGKGNNFNHFPNGTLMDTFFPRGVNEYPAYFNENLSLCDYYEGGNAQWAVEENYPYGSVNSQPEPDYAK